MIVSPAQAKKLLCPHRDGKDGGSVCCVANACMAWRWADMSSAYGTCGLAIEPQVYRLQSGAIPPVRHGRTILTTTDRTVDQGKSIEPRKPVHPSAASELAALAAGDPASEF